MHVASPPFFWDHPPFVWASKSHAQLVDQVLVCSAKLHWISTLYLHWPFVWAPSFPHTKSHLDVSSFFFFFWAKNVHFSATVFSLLIFHFFFFFCSVCVGLCIIAKAICRGQWKPLSLVGIFEALIYSINPSARRARSGRRSPLMHCILFGQFERRASCMWSVVSGDWPWEFVCWMETTSSWNALKVSDSWI